MNSLNKLSRGMQITGGAGILLLIGLLAFPWYEVSFSGFGISVSATRTAVQANGAWAAVIGVIVLIALLVVIFVRRFTSTQLPDLPVSWSSAELYAAILIAVLIAVKFISHIGNFGWGFYIDVLLTIALVYGAVLLSREGDTATADSAQSTV